MRFAYELIDDYSVSCDWFAIPTTGGGTASDGGDGDITDGDTGETGDTPDADENDEDGDVTGTQTGADTVVTYACPKDTTTRDAYAVYAAACTDTREGAIFKLDGDRSGNPGEQISGADGSASWANREADRYYLYEPESPAGYGTPVIYCDTYVALDGLVPDYAAFDASTGRIDFDLAAGESITCSWFGIPGSQGVEITSEDQDEVQDQDQDQSEDQDTATTVDTTASITVYQWRCPAGIDLAAASASPWLECAVATDDVAFTLASSSGAGQPPGDFLSGGVRWDGLAAGDYQIDDPQADDAAAGFVLACHGLTASAAYPLYSTESGAPLEIALGAGQQVACLWFTVPAAA